MCLHYIKRQKPQAHASQDREQHSRPFLRGVCLSRSCNHRTGTDRFRPCACQRHGCDSERTIERSFSRAETCQRFCYGRFHSAPEQVCGFVEIPLRLPPKLARAAMETQSRKKPCWNSIRTKKRKLARQSFVDTVDRRIAVPEEPDNSQEWGDELPPGWFSWQRLWKFTGPGLPDVDCISGG